MYTKLFLVSIFLLGSLTVWAEQVTIKGHVDNPAGKKAAISYETQAVGGEKIVEKAELNDKGDFTLKFDLDKARFVTFSHGRERSELYFIPGDVVKLNLDTEQFDETLKFEGKDPSVAINNFMMEHYLQFKDEAFFEERKRRQSPESVITDTRDWYLERMGNQMNMLSENANAHKLDADFVKLMQSKIQYDAMNAMLNVPNFKSYMTGATLEELDVTDDYYVFLSKVEVDRPALIELQEYQQFLYLYAKYKADTKENISPVEIGKDIYAGTVREVFEASIIEEYLIFLDFEEAEGYYMAFKENFEESPYLEHLTKIYEDGLLLAPGKMAPQFTLKNEKGEEVSLSDFKGKVVYMDFWASWCGPCRAEMPHSKKLKTAFVDKDVVFLYVSIDNTEDAWKKGMTDMGIEGEGKHAWAPGFQHDVPQSYQVKGIPAYFLINRDGTINNSRPARPSNEKVYEQIESALAKNP